MEWTPVRPICEKLGLDPCRQREKLIRSSAFTKRYVRAPGRDGKNYKMLCIRREDVERYIEFAQEFLRGPYKKKEL